MKRLVCSILLLLLLLAGTAQAVINYCAITGTVYNADGSTCNNCTVTFAPNGQGAQVVNGTTVYPKVVFTTTNATGVMTSISLIQGTAMIVTITDANGNISAEQPVPIPYNAGATISQVLAMNYLQPGATSVSALNLGTKVITSASSPYTIAATDLVVLCNASGGAVTINLPASTGTGRWLEVKKTDSSANACTVTRAGTDTIDGLTTWALNLQYAAVDLKDGAVGVWAPMSAYRQQYVGLDLGNNALTGVSSFTTTSLTVGPGTVNLTGNNGSQVSIVDVNGYRNPMAWGALCDGSTDDTAAFMGASVCTGASAPSACCTGAGTGPTCGHSGVGALGTGNVFVKIPAGKTCNVDHLIIPTTTVIEGDQRAVSGLKITNTGGGACALGSNGGILINANSVTLKDLNITGSSTSLDCLINIGSSSVAVSFIRLSGLNLSTTGVAVATTNPIAIYAPTTVAKPLVELYMDHITTTANEFRQQVVLGSIAGSVSHVVSRDNVWQPNSASYPTVYNNQNYMFDFANAVSGEMSGDVFETGPNMLDLGSSNTGGPFSINGSYFGDGTVCLPWKPAHAYTAGQCVQPALEFTGDTHSNTTVDGIASTASLAVGMRLDIPGAGSAGADLATFVASITSSTAITIANATSNSVAGQYAYGTNWGGHIFVAMNDGTSAASGSQPTWPTGLSATVVDNPGASQITWREFREGAGIRDGIPAVSITGSQFGVPIPIAVINDGSSIGARGINIEGNFFGGNNGVVGVWCGGCKNVNESGDHSYGPWLMYATQYSTQFAQGNHVSSSDNYNNTYTSVLETTTGATGNTADGIAGVFGLGYVGGQTTSRTPAGWSVNQTASGNMSGFKLTSHFISPGATYNLPTVGACGTNPGVASGTDTVGQIVTGTNWSTCVVNFSTNATAFASAPKCFINDESAVTAEDINATATTAALTIHQNTGAPLAPAHTIDWWCPSNS